MVVSNGTTSTQGFLTTMDRVAPSFLLASTAGYIVATHRNNALVGPLTLYPTERPQLPVKQSLSTELVSARQPLL